MNKPLTILSIASSVTALISSCFGVLYSFGDTQRIVVSFVILGTVALALNVRLLKHAIY